MREYEKLERDFRADRETMKALVDLPDCTRDGVTVKLLANIGKTADVEAALLFKADGIGLFEPNLASLYGIIFPQKKNNMEFLKMSQNSSTRARLRLGCWTWVGTRGCPIFHLPKRKTRRCLSAG